MDKANLICELISSNCVKFGQFTLKGGLQSSYYVDLRESTLNPLLFHMIVEEVTKIVPRKEVLTQWIEARDKSSTAIAGVPYGVVPIAAAVAYNCKLPYYPLRKEVKHYGNKMDTSLMSGHNYIIIEDVMTTGSSILTTIKSLEGKKVTDVIVVVNRESGGEENIRAQYPDIKVHSILKISEILKYRDNNGQ